MAKKEVNNEKIKNNFSKELKAEMKKVTWPTLKRLVNDTSAVLVIVIIVAVTVFVLDVCFENLNEFGVNKIKALVSDNVENSDETEESEEYDESEIINIDADQSEESADEENVEEGSEGENTNESEESAGNAESDENVE